MTATATKISIARHTNLLRGGLFCLHCLVVALVLASILAGRFWQWIDLRNLHQVGLLLMIVWCGATLLVPVLAGPWPGGRVGKPRWVQQGLHAEWALRLLWPTYGVLACLTANLTYYVKLAWEGDADWRVSSTLLAWVVLGAWTLLTREWVRRQGGLGATAAAGRWLHVRAAVFLAGAVVVPTLGWTLERYARPPAGPVDLAVVLGAGTRRDGTASTELAERVKVAVGLYKRGLVNHIMLSGAIIEPNKPGKPAENEVAAMLQVCQEAGIPEEAIILDPVGVNTRATAFNAAKLMRERGWKTVVACSTDFHLLRTRMSFVDYGVDAYALPSRPALWQSDVPSQTLRELLAIAVYKMMPHYREPKGALMQLVNPRVVVHKNAGKLELFDGITLVKTYACITGGNEGDKEREGDRKTPLGNFHIVYKNPQSKFHLSLGLDYPNHEDAQRGLAAGMITEQEYRGIMEALSSDLSKKENQDKLWYTKLGGEIFIHGYANGRTGTAGCVALQNPDIEELFAVVPVGTPVEIGD
ncbi:MAG TPA: L,D-transpeptidase family protein [Phycisphaerae bacterium]|nr:L,D-transpeptidase family protein [Phycisphaerae bacterium]